MHSQLDFYPNSQAFFFFGERGKKERLIHLLHESSAAPKLRYLSTFVLLSRVRFYRKFKRFATKAAIIEMVFIYPRYSQAVNVTLS